MKVGLLNTLFFLLAMWSVALFAQPGRTHTVERKETAYGIARQYGVDLNALFSLNPWAEKGLHKGDVLRIPDVVSDKKPDPELPDSVDWSEETVEERDRQRPRQRPIPPDWPRDTVRVAVFLPFYEGEKKLGSPQFRLQQVALDCAAGIELALEAERVEGAHFEVRFLDTGSDASGDMLCSELDLAEWSQVDLAIGPLRRSRFEKINSWSKLSGATHVALTDLGEGVLKKHPGVVLPYVQVEARMEGLARHMASRHRGEQVLMLVTDEKSNLEAEDAFRHAWSSLSKGDSLLLLKELSVDARDLGPLRRALSDVRRNILVVPGGKENRSLAARLQTEIQMKGAFDFKLYVDADWMDFDFLDLDMRERVGFTVVDGYFTPADSSSVGVLDPGLSCVQREMVVARGADAGGYGWMAFDVMSEAMRWTAGHGALWSRELADGVRLILAENSGNGHLHRFHWTPSGDAGDGLENRAVRILRQENLKWVEVDQFDLNP